MNQPERVTSFSSSSTLEKNYFRYNDVKSHSAVAAFRHQMTPESHSNKDLKLFLFIYNYLQFMYISNT